MIINITITPENWYNSVHELLRSAFVDYQLNFQAPVAADLALELKVEAETETVGFHGRLMTAAGKMESEAARQILLPLATAERQKEISRLLRIFVFEWISEYQGRPFSEYGILSGVRPLKILHRLLDRNMEPEAIIRHMQEQYRVAPEKARFLLEVALNNHALLNTPEQARRKIGLYIGIPYCPTRCYYCSFPGAVLRRYEKDIPPFLEALYREIRTVGTYLKAHGIIIQNLYIGGGTPTVLNEEDLAELLGLIHTALDVSACEEFTVEAGRPDTLNETKLTILKQQGIDRICVNPQTMNNETLKRIGRRHTAEQIEETIALARKVGFHNINMDLIAGLTGESQMEYLHTMERILALRPENITVHSLAVKRGSVLAEKEGLSKVSGQAGEIARAMAHMAETLKTAGYIPYYMYRQKYMKANMENTGYTLPGKQCLYNVQIMEERQTILGLGGGASSKFVHPEDWTLSSFHNPKDPKSYIDHLDHTIKVKLGHLDEIARRQEV